MTTLISKIAFILFIIKSSLGGVLECEQICGGITKSIPKPLRGRPGPPGPTDYKAIDEVVQVKMKELTKSLEMKMIEMQKKFEEKLEMTVQSLKNEISSTKEALCHVRYNEKCFWIVAQTGTNFKVGEETCAKVPGGKPANIYDQKHYDSIIKHMRSQIPSDVFGLYLWIGMTYDFQSKNVKLNDGKTSTFVKWREHYPGMTHEYTGLLIMARRDAAEKFEGIYNQNPKYKKPGVLCEA
ncbi:uncharacterized protein LOC120328819 [Styela clava]